MEKIAYLGNFWVVLMYGKLILYYFKRFLKTRANTIISGFCIFLTSLVELLNHYPNMQKFHAIYSNMEKRYYNFSPAKTKIKLLR